MNKIMGNVEKSDKNIQQSQESAAERSTNSLVTLLARLGL